MMKLNTIYNEPNLETMARMPDNSVDAIVTDPPYGLGKAPDPAKMLAAWLDHGYLEVKGRGFMGKEWDAFVPQPRFWQEAFRVLKPGGHVLSFFGTRTYDWGVMAMRLAGFEVRDCLMWVYGSGFPKSHDISKAIDKAAGAERGTDYKAEKENNIYSNGKGKAAGVSRLPGAILSHPAITPEAQQWQGWGSALKPAVEPIVLARKPLAEKNLASNVLAWGTGGLNVDGCRVETREEGGRPKREVHQFRDGVEYNGNSLQGRKDGTLNSSKAVGTTNQGRWPANLAHDGSPEVLAGMPETGPAKSGGMSGDDPGMWAGKNKTERGGHDDNGGSAARFFYCAKADATERSYGLPKGKKNRHPTVKPLALMRWLVRLITPPGGLVYDPYSGSGTTFAACMEEGFQFVGSELDAEHAEVGNARGLARRSLFSQE